MGERPAVPRRRRWGDRADGRRLRGLDPLYEMIPFVMRTRVDAQNSFEDRIDVGPAEAWLRAQRAAGRPGLGFLHLFLAALVRTVSQRPALNRFVAGQRLYARNELVVSLVLKPRLSEESPEAVVKLRLDPAATVFEVAAAVDAVVSANRAPAAHNEADRLARFFVRLPGPLLRAVVAFLTWLDFHGLMPRALREGSPFHVTAFVTDLGSLGIKPIYHHLYEFGTTSLFVAFGRKERERVLEVDGTVALRKTIGLKAVTDERICDGYYFASAFKLFLSFFRRPELLESPPERVVEDVE
jgi:hypothetical protein